jgi:AraC family transcriptional regulator
MGKGMINSKSVGARGKTPAEGVEDQHSFAPGKILVSDKDGALRPLFPADEALLTSDGCPWTGIIVEEHHLPPTEFPERTPERHLIALHFRPATIEWSLGGHPQTKRMTRGSIDIIPQGTPLGGYSKDETEFLMLSLDPALVERTAKESGAVKHVELNRNLGIRDEQIEHISLALKAELEAGCPSGRLYGESLAIALAAHLLSEYVAQVPDTDRHSAGLPGYKLRRVIDYINENLTEELTLTEIANVVQMNPHYFSRAFRDSTGIPPHRYVMNSRVERAKNLLTDEELPLVEIRLSVGFQNQSHFTTLFRKLTGVTPKAYRDGI